MRSNIFLRPLKNFRIDDWIELSVHSDEKYTLDLHVIGKANIMET